MTPTLHLVWHIASAPCVGHWDKNAPHLLVRAHLSKPKEAQGSSVAGTCARLIDAIVALGSPATKGMWDVPGVGTTAVALDCTKCSAMSTEQGKSFKKVSESTDAHMFT
ncbi:TPA: hypothetical protein ACH3X3_008462 [Trebouxia sp. C0006]